MRERRDHGRLLAVASYLTFLSLAAPACGGGGGGAGSQFCNEWAAAFCHRVWACTADPSSNPFAGPSEGECAKGYAMLCSQPPTADQTFDVNCSGGKHVNEAAKTLCLNELNNVSCDDFNASTYHDDCDQVCTAGGGVGSGGSGGTGGMGGTGGTSGGGCGTVQPCGGSLVGTWGITQICVNGPTMGDPNCPGDTVSNVSATETGTLVFASGGTYTANVSSTVMYSEMTPVSCVDPLTCAELADSYAAIGGAATCTGTTVCACMIAIASSGSAEAGTYAASGTSVTVTPSGGTPRAMGYCVQGDSVHFLHFNSAGQVTTEEIARRQ
jgi:hypothetical protein